MNGMPEGTQPPVRRVPRKWLVFAALFGCYLAFRLVQITLWLLH